MGNIKRQIDFKTLVVKYFETNVHLLSFVKSKNSHVFDIGQ